MTRVQLQKELEGLVAKREQQVRDLGMTDGAIQTIAYFIKDMERVDKDGSVAPAKETDVSE